MELTREQIEQSDRIDNAAYDLLKALAVKPGTSDDTVDTVFPWDMYLIGELIDAATDILKTNGFTRIYRPYLDENEIAYDYEED